VYRYDAPPVCYNAPVLHEREINSIVEQVKPWPQEERVALAYLILRDMRKQTREPAPRRTLERALGVAKGTSPPPDDATVKKWVQEHRIRKHG
jgi:hypothetical protein